MKTLALQLDVDEAATHPMHAFVADHPAYGPTRLLQWNPRVGATNVLLFYVDGPPEPFLSALAEVETAEVVEPSATDEEGFYLFVRERLDGSARELVGAYAESDVVVVPPVVYDVDGSVRLTVVGNADALQSAVDRTPDGIDVTVRRVGSGATGVGGPRSDLSDRQREALATAVATGYYEEPRAATLDDVADRLDCAPSTAAEHLRKAEAQVVRRATRAPVWDGRARPPE